MGWVIWICLLLFLSVAYLDQRKTLTLKNGITIFAVYFLCNFSVNFFGILLPVGFIIGWIYRNKTKQSYLSKALIFGLISVYVLAYAPKISFHQMSELSQVRKYSAEFNQVKAVSYFSKESDINVLLKAAAENLKDKNPKSEIPLDDPHVAFSIWVLQHKNMAMNDLDWLWYTAPRELHYFWQTNRPNPLTTIEYVIFNEVGYMGVFQRTDTNSPYDLHMIYEFDKLKTWNAQIP